MLKGAKLFSLWADQPHRATWDLDLLSKGDSFDEEYQGVRLKMIARLARAQIPVQVDIGFGDIITPPPTLQVYPTLLDFPPPEILTYSRETVSG